MKRIVGILSLAAIGAGWLPGQNASGKQFELADVHVSAPGTNEDGGMQPGGRLEIRGTTMLHVIMWAYNVEEDAVVGGPQWLDTDRFDILAKTSPGTPEEALRGMLQGLLADRFQLVVHQEQKAMPVWVLKAPKRGPQLKESAGADDAKCDLTVPEGVRTYTCHSTTIGNLAQRLRMVAGAYFNHPVVDETGLKGAYDFTLKWVGRGQLAPGGHAGDGASANSLSLFDYMEKQLGIQAEVEQRPSRAIVVERVNQKPTDNPAGVTSKLPPPPTEFEVAEVRPSKTGEEQISMRNGRLDAHGVTLRQMITLAYDTEDNMVTGGEKWLDTDRFEVVAKSQPNVSFDALRGMLQKLLEQRFQLKVHKEDQVVPVYALTAGKKTKLQEASGQERAGCKLGVDDGLRTLTCQNTTMEQFAEKIRPAAAAYLEHPVVDLTGLKGAFDFAVKWTGKGRVMPNQGHGGEAAAAGAMPAASEPSNALTVFEAVERQLGLKLAAQKHPLPVVVIDHLERTPTAN